MTDTSADADGPERAPDPAPASSGPPAPRPRRRRGRLARGLLYVVLALSLLCAAAAYRLTRGPIALPDWTVARIEERIGDRLAPRTVRIGGVALAYDLEAQALRLRLQDLRLVEEGAPILTLPDARVALDGGALLRGKVRPRRVTVDGLALDVARDAEGRFSLAFGRGGGALPATWGEALDTLDTALATPAIAELAEVTVEGVELRLSDAVTGLEERVEDGTVIWRRDGRGVRLSLTSSLRLGGRVARGAAVLTRVYGEDGAGKGARAQVSLDGVSLSGLAGALPGIRALTLLTGDIGGTAELSLAEDGTPGPLRGQLEARQARLTDRPRLALDRAVLDFAWLPGSGRIALREIAAASDDVSLRATGQLLLEDGLVGPLQAQLMLGRTIFDPEGLFDRRVEFSDGVIEARLTQTPLALRVGRAAISGPSGTAVAAGRIAFPPSGPEGSLRLTVPRMAVDELAALWPATLKPNARRWFTENLLGGEARQATGILRFAAGREPELAATFGIAGASFQFLRDMPAAQEVTGVAQLDGNRLTLRLDEGWVPARRSADPGAPEGVAESEPPGRVNLAGTTFTIADARQSLPMGEIELAARGEIGDILVLLDNPPFNLLDRLQKDRNLAGGEMAARVSVRLPLRSGNAPADIDYDVTARLTGVESTRIVPGRVLAAEELTLSVAPGLVSIAGDMTLEGVPFSGTWSQALPAPSTEVSAAEAPAGPPEPLPEPGRLTGTARVDPAGLARLGIEVEALELAGTTTAQVEVSLPQGRAPRLTVTSDLRGMAAALPVINWSKDRDREAAFAVEATLGEVAEVTSLVLDAPGLDARGRISLRDDGSLERATFGRVETGWFAGPVTLRGRGGDAAPAVTIGGGQADLRRALLNAGGEGASGGGSPPLDIALSRLTVTEGITLTDLRATLRGESGSFTARINGGAAVEGALGPDRGGTAVQVRGAQAGAVLRSAGLFEDARGGSLTMTLRPTGEEGVYAGALRIGDVRVRDAPALASLLQALSVVGILEQLTGEGLFFTSVESDFMLRPDSILVRHASAVGPSMSITADGAYDIGTDRMDLQGVISPIYLVNGLFGALFARRDEGLFGFNYTLEGPAKDPQVSVNPLSILTPGIFRDIFRKAPPS